MIHSLFILDDIVSNKIKITLNALFTFCQAIFTYDAK